MNHWRTSTGQVVCDDHMTEHDIVLEGTPEWPPAPMDRIELEYAGRCFMCETPAVEGRTCALPSCGKALHPRWPAVYCSNRCAIKDAVDPELSPAAVCRRCGCTDADCSGCIQRTGQPCFWAEPDLCSACWTP